MEMYDQDLATLLKKEAGKKYRPSNGSEGEIFTDYYCARCVREEFMHTMNDNDKKCEILTSTMFFDVDDEKYPSEWQYTKDGQPTCTAFELTNRNKT